ARIASSFAPMARVASASSSPIAFTAPRRTSALASSRGASAFSSSALVIPSAIAALASPASPFARAKEAPDVSIAITPSSAAPSLIRLIPNRELGKFTRIPPPAHVHLIDARRGRPVVRPAHDFLDRVLFAFGHDLDAAVVAVLHPSGDAEPARLA